MAAVARSACAPIKTPTPRIAPHQAIYAVRGDRVLHSAGAVVADGRNSAPVAAVPGDVEIVVDQSMSARMQRQIAGLAALAGDFQVRHAFARVPKILHLQLAQLLAPQRMEQQRRQDGAVALALDGIRVGRCEQFARLVVADRRRLAFAAFGLRPLDAFDRVVGDGVLLAEILEQRGRRGRPVPDRRAAELAPVQLAAKMKTADAWPPGRGSTSVTTSQARCSAAPRQARNVSTARVIRSSAASPSATPPA